MGYRVDYRPVRKIRGMEKRFSRSAALTGLFFLIFLLTTSFLWPEGMQVLKNLVVPGDSVVTAAALEELTEELQAGESAAESLGLFLRRILERTGLDSGR